jgi:hypothetical protein
MYSFPRVNILTKGVTTEARAMMDSVKQGEMRTLLHLHHLFRHHLEEAQAEYKPIAVLEEARSGCNRQRT